MQLEKITIGLLISTIIVTPSFAAIKPTINPAKAKVDTIIEVKSDETPNYCNFNKQIVNIGYDKKDNIIMACVKRN